MKRSTVRTIIRLGVPIVAALAVPATPGYGTPSDPSARELIERGKAALEKGTYPKALSLFERAQATGSEVTYEALVGQAEARLCERHYQSSAKLSRTAYEATVEPVDRGRALTLMGWAFLRAATGTKLAEPNGEASQARLDEAETLFEQALAVSHDEYVTAHYFLGLLDLRKKDYSRAIDQLELYLQQPGGVFELRANDLLSGLQELSSHCPAVLEPSREEGNPKGSGTCRMEPPRIQSGDPPEYPRKARMAGFQGEVTVEAQIDTDGGVSQVRVVKGAQKDLDRAAREALGNWRFAPATVNGEPVAIRYSTTFTFGQGRVGHNPPECVLLP